MKKSVLLLAVNICSCFYCNISYSQTPDWLWAKGAGGTGYDFVSSVAVSDSGNIYMAGYFRSPIITFGSDTLINAGSYDIYLTKYDANGNVLWAKSAGGTGNDEVFSIAMDASGNIYIAGRFASSTITFGTYTLTNIHTGNDDIFLAKYDANGNVLWAKSVGGIGNDFARVVVVNGSGNIYMAGAFECPSITFGTYTLINTTAGGGVSDTFLTKYDANGNVLWAKSAGGTSYDEPNSITVDNSGNIYMAGTFNSPTITFGSYTLTNAGGMDIFLAKYDTTGNVLWAKSAGDNDSQFGCSVSVDASGNIYMAGTFNSTTITFGATTLTSAGMEDIFLAKYDTNGNVLWAKSAGGTNWDNAGSVVVDVSGNIYLAGEFASPTITFGTYTLINTSAATGISDLFLTKFDANGNVLWAKSAGGTGNDEQNSIAVDTSGNIYMVGTYTGQTINFGSTSLTNAGLRDIFLAKFGNSTGINKLRDPLTISIYPNPATDKITIETSAISNKSQLSIMNLSGQEIITRQILEPRTCLDISSLPPGVYFVRLTGERAVQMGKFIKY